VHQAAEGGQASLVSTQDLLEAIDRYKRVRSVVEKIRYGQYCDRHTPIRVRYAETDCMKVVYYANYLIYFEVARVEFLRQQGHAMSDVDQKVHMPVVEAVVRYHKPALLDDLLQARCWIAERKRASFRFGYELVNDRGERVASGSTLHACWDRRRPR